MPEAVQLTYDKHAFQPEALQMAAYRAVNCFTIELAATNDNYQCTLIPNSDVGEDAFRQAIEEFRKDVIDYQLRMKLKAETEQVRNLILGIAFSRTGLQDRG